MFDSHRVFSLVYTVLQKMYIDMYRQFRLSTHWKDEFRRRGGCMVTTKAVALETVSELTQANDTEPELLVRLPRDNISVLGISLDLRFCHALNVHTAEQFR